MRAAAATTTTTTTTKRKRRRRRRSSAFHGPAAKENRTHLPYIYITWYIEPAGRRFSPIRHKRARCATEKFFESIFFSG
jgi:hypothetical protein